MNTPNILFPIAATVAVQAVMHLLPFGLLAAFSLTLEIILNTFDRTFSACWWFFFSVVMLALSEIIWQSWTASTPVADIILYGETAGQLTFSIIAFVVIVCALLLWMIIAGTRQIIIEAHGSGWGWALLRMTPLLPFAWFVFRTLVNGNALVGETGFINLITR